MKRNEPQEVIALFEQLQKECRLLLDKPDKDFTDQDARKLQALYNFLSKLEQKLPEYYFTPECSWNRFIARPDIQEAWCERNETVREP